MNSLCASLRIFMISEVICESVKRGNAYVLGLLAVARALCEVEFFLLAPQGEVGRDFFLVAGVGQHVAFEEFVPLDG